MYMYMQEIIQQLEERHIPYTLREHPPVYTMEALKTMADMPHAAYICKNLLVRNAKKTAYYIVCMSQGKKIPLKKLGMQIANTRFSLASPEEMEAYLQCRPGSVSPLGVLNDTAHMVQVVLDAELVDWPWIGMHPNENTATLWMAPKDLIGLLQEMGHAVRIQKLGE